MAERQYPFPSRTRKSSSPAPMIVPSRRESRWLPGFFFFWSFLWGKAFALMLIFFCHPCRLVRNHMEPFRALPAMRVPTPAAACGGRRRRRPSPIASMSLKNAGAFFLTALRFWAGCRAFFCPKSSAPRAARRRALSSSFWRSFRHFRAASWACFSFRSLAN